MEREKGAYRFTKAMFLRGLTPALVSGLGLAFSDIADALVVGQRMGEVGLAAISLALPVYMVINFVMHGIGQGGSIRFSRLLGEGEDQKARDSFSMMMEIIFLSGILLAVLGNLFLTPILGLLGTVPGDGELFDISRGYIQIIITGIPLFFLSYVLNYYLRNDDFQKLAAFGFMTGNLTDLALNIILVLFFNMGAAGAAWSTIIGQVVALAIYLGGLARRCGNLKFHLVKPVWSHVASCFQVGFSASVQYVFQMIFLLIGNRMLMKAGKEYAVAVFDLVQNASFLILYLYEAVAKAAQPVISAYLGERDDGGRKEMRRLSLIWGMGFGGMMVAVVLWKPEFLCALFGIASPQSLELGVYALRIYAFSAIFAGILILTENYYQSSEREKAAFLIAALRGTAVLLPVTALCAAIGVEGFWFLYPITEILSLCLFFLWERRTKPDEGGFDRARVYQKMIENHTDDIGMLTEEMEEFLERWEADGRQSYFGMLAAEEICLSISSQDFSANKGGYIQITMLALENEDFELHIRDNLPAFNPFSLDEGENNIENGNENENKNENEENLPDLDAMGMMLVRKTAKYFFYRRYQGFNTMVIKI